jgi:hypothetical protein
MELRGTANEGRFSDAIWSLENDKLGFGFHIHRGTSRGPMLFVPRMRVYMSLTWSVVGLVQYGI